MIFLLSACLPPDDAGPQTTGTPQVDCAAGYWTPAGTLADAHYEHLTAALPGGGAMVAGGHGVTETSTNTYYAVSDTEVWDPTSETWHAAGNFDPPGYSLGGVALADGRVLIAGYPDWDGDNNHVALFDPDTEDWISTTPTPVTWLGVPVQLDDGRVLAVATGSWDGDVLTPHAEVEIFDPILESWTATAPLGEARQYSGGMVVLLDGTVLVAGGLDANAGLTASAERFDPVSGEWRPTTPMNEPRGNGLVLLDEGVADRMLGDLAVSAGDLSDILDYLCAAAIHRRVFFLWRPTLSDPKDDMVLELAVDAGAPVIVTFNSREAARREGISINQFIASAAGEKLAAWATEEYLAARARRGDRGKFEAALGRVLDRQPDPEDAL